VSISRRNRPASFVPRKDDLSQHRPIIFLMVRCDLAQPGHALKKIFNVIGCFFKGAALIDRINRKRPLRGP
jgi:hypothetical protein